MQFNGLRATFLSQFPEFLFSPACAGGGIPLRNPCLPKGPRELLCETGAKVMYGLVCNGTVAGGEEKVISKRSLAKF